MASSDYCYLVIHNNRTVEKNTFTNKQGFSLEIYKNFFYLKSEAVYPLAKNDYVFPVVGQINSGSFNLCGFEGNIEQHFNYKFFHIAFTDSRGVRQEFFGIVGSLYHSAAQLLKLDGKIDQVSSSFEHPQIEWINALVTKDQYYIYSFKKKSHKYRGITKSMVKQLVGWAKKECYATLAPQMPQSFYVSPLEGKLKLKNSKSEIKALAVKGSWYRMDSSKPQQAKIVKFLMNLKANRWQV